MNQVGHAADQPGGSKRLWRYLLVTALVVADQWSKLVAVRELHYGVPEPVLFWLNWTLLYNPGAAFSMLANAGGWQRLLLVAISAGVSLVLIVLLWRLPDSQRLQNTSLVLILAGALGNLIDRIRLGEVIDFVQVHYAGWYFPAFNLADSAITLGVVGLLALEILQITNRRRER